MKKAFLSSVALLASLTATATAAPLAEGGAKFVGNITTSGQIRNDMGTYWNPLKRQHRHK